MGPYGSEKSANLLFLAGIYSRVARQLGVHPSYVSRVARGERRSDRVYRAIATELAKLRVSASAHLVDNSEIKASRMAAARELRQRLAATMKSDPRLRRLGLVTIDVGGEDVRKGVPRRVSAASLSARLAANARLMAVTIGAFEKLTSRFERFPHVLSLLDSDSVVLFSAGTTGMARRENRVPGADWSRDWMGPSSASRAIAAGVPIAVIGAIDLQGSFMPTVRMACPVRLSDGSIAGVLTMTIEITNAKPDHLLEICKLARKVCKFVENGPMATAGRKIRSKIEPFANAARHVAMVLSLPQLDPALRAALSGLLADLENGGREILLAPTTRRRRKGNAHAQSAL